MATKILGALALSLCLSACGGGGDSSQTVEALSVCRPKPTVHVQLFGDSTMVNLDAFTKNTGGAPALQQAMDTRFGVGVVTIENRAMPGTNSTQLLAGQDGLNQAWPLSVAADVIVINHGMNDQSRQRTPLTEYQSNLRAFTNTGVPLLFMTPNPSSTEPDVGPYAATMLATAQSLSIPVADVFTYLSGLSDWPSLLLDGVHPAPTTEATIVRDVVAPALVKMIAPMLCD